MNTGVPGSSLSQINNLHTDPRLAPGVVVLEQRINKAAVQVAASYEELFHVEGIQSIGG